MEKNSKAKSQSKNIQKSTDQFLDRQTNKSAIAWSALPATVGAIVTIANYLLNNKATFLSYCIFGLGVVVLIVGIARFLWVLWRRLKQRIRPQPKYILYGGALWDSGLNPICSPCKQPLALSGDGLTVVSGTTPQTPRLYCAQCQSYISLYDMETGKELTVKEARKNIRKLYSHFAV